MSKRNEKKINVGLKNIEKHKDPLTTRNHFIEKTLVIKLKYILVNYNIVQSIVIYNSIIIIKQKIRCEIK